MARLPPIKELKAGHIAYLLRAMVYSVQDTSHADLKGRNVH